MKPIPSKIISIRWEGKDRKTITVLNKQIAKSAIPGQFIMVWIPGVDEIPMGISHIGDEAISFTVHKVGEATAALHEMKVGDYIGVRGPFGRGFKEVNGNVIIIGGGTGMAPLMPLVIKLIEKERTKVTVINGAKSLEEMVYKYELDELSKMGKIKYIPATEDGSLGYHGLATEALKEVLNRGEKIDEIYVCGPEIMIKKVMEIALEKQIHMQAAIERYIKCAIGICGSCAVDPIGLRVCTEGPVIPLEILVKISELGVYRREASGVKKSIKH